MHYACSLESEDCPSNAFVWRIYVMDHDSSATLHAASDFQETITRHLLTIHSDTAALASTLHIDD